MKIISKERENQIYEKEDILEECCKLLKCTPNQLSGRIMELIEVNAQLKSHILFWKERTF